MNKVLKYVLTVIVVAVIAIANPIDDKASTFVYQGAPVSSIKKNDQYLIKKNYAVHYRYDTKTAEYVVEHVTKECVTGPSKRENDFRADPELPKEHQSLLSDYAGFPYDRGHLAPAGDNTQDDDAMSESFFLSNMVPQVPNNNRGIWKQLETFVRNWVLEGKDIYVVTGTVYNKGYTSIGDNHVGVPTHVWKVIVDKKSNKAIAFIFPNTALPVEDMPKYAVSIDEVEKQTGINFMPKLTPALEKSIEKTKPVLKDWSGLDK